MLMLDNCSNCRTPLHLPPGAQSIRCAICHAITHIADPRSGNNQQHPPTAAAAPSPYNHGPPGRPPNSHGRKRALIVGMSYKNTRLELKEEETDPIKRPTKHNMRLALHWLVQGCQAGDSLVFHYSGRGSQLRNYNGDGVDGYDETLCPLNFETQGMIVDNEINATIVKPLPRGAKLHAIIDASHSGNLLDLPFFCRMDRNGRYVWEEHLPRSGMWKGTSGGEAISLSAGCEGVDTSALSKITPTGAMTYIFIQAIERRQATTYGKSLNAMRSTIRKTASEIDGGLVKSITKLLTEGSVVGGLTEEPQLAAVEPFDVYSKPFSL